MEVLATLLADSLGGEDDASFGRRDIAYGTRRLNSLLLSLGSEESAIASDPSTKKDVGTLSIVKCQKVRAMMLQASQGEGETAALGPSPLEADRIGSFADMSAALASNASPADGAGPVNRLAWSMREFVEWADADVSSARAFWLPPEWSVASWRSAGSIGICSTQTKIPRSATGSSPTRGGGHQIGPDHGRAFQETSTPNYPCAPYL